MTTQDKATSRAESGEDVDTLVRSMTDCLKSGHGYYLPMDSISTVNALLAAEREQCRTAMVASQAEVDALYARAEKAEAELHLAQLEIAARKQECQTVTRKRDKAEAEATRYREALEQAYRDFDELSGAMEGDYDFAGIRNSASIFKAQARAALDAGKE